MYMYKYTLSWTTYHQDSLAKGFVPSEWPNSLCKDSDEFYSMHIK